MISTNKSCISVGGSCWQKIVCAEHNFDDIIYR